MRETKTLGMFRVYIPRDVHRICTEYNYHLGWSNYSDLTRPHPKWWFSKGNPLISGKSRLVICYNLASFRVYNWLFYHMEDCTSQLSGDYFINHEM